MNIKDSLKKDISLEKRQFSVMVYDLDVHTSSGMPMICNWFQETGITHGIAITDDAGIASSDVVFVLTRLYVRMDRYPSWKESVTIESWLSPITDRYVKRNFLIHGSDGRIIGRGINSAVPFNLKERTGGTLPENLDHVQTVDREPAVPHDFNKIPPVENPDYAGSLKVRYFDCDLYRHVNNVKYIQWCMETLPDDYITSHSLNEIDVNFRAEGNMGDTLLLKTAKDDRPDSFIHTISDSAGTKDLVRMTSAWSAR